MKNSSSESIRVFCSHCRASLKCSAKLLDHPVRCPKCGKKFKATAPQPEPSVVSPVEPQTSPPPVSTPRFDREFVDPPPPSITATYRNRMKKTVTTRPQLVTTGLVLLVPFIGILACVIFMSDDFLLNLFLFGIVIGFILFYFVPSLIAFARKHQNVVPILVLNIFFGWTFLGWVACLAWSLSSHVRESRNYTRQVIINGNTEDP